MGETYSTGEVYSKLKAAAAIAGVVWNVAVNDDEALRYIKDVGKYDRMKVEEQLRRQGDSDIADWIS